MHETQEDRGGGSTNAADSSVTCSEDKKKNESPQNSHWPDRPSRPPRRGMRGKGQDEEKNIKAFVSGLNLMGSFFVQRHQCSLWASAHRIAARLTREQCIAAASAVAASSPSCAALPDLPTWGEVLGGCKLRTRADGDAVGFLSPCSPRGPKGGGS